MSLSWSPGFLDKLIAPEISRFTQVQIPDLVDRFPQAPYWLVNHSLNSALRASYPKGHRQIILAYLRRAHHAFVAYHSGREITFRYLNGNKPDTPRVGLYYDAVANWENFALQVSMALDLFRWLNQGEGAFKKNDGSKEQRLYTIANQLKHLTSCVESGQCTETDTAPVWLTNMGLNSFDVTVTYSEAAEVLSDIAQLADELQDCLSFVKRDKVIPAAKAGAIRFGTNDETS